jgi:hypothetical protein
MLIAPRRCSVSLFFTETRWVVAFACAACVFGSSGARLPEDLTHATRAELQAALAAESILEAGAPDEMASARNRQRTIAEAAAARVMQLDASGQVASPDSVVMDWIGICNSGYARALRQDAVRLDRGAESDGSFRSTWNEMVSAYLDFLDRWPGLWRDGGGTTGHRGVGPTIGALPEQLILLCSPEAYAGESFALPRECLFPRMATLPESLFRCCVDPGECLPQRGATCLDQLAADIARQTDLDALVGYQNGSRYWSLPSDAPPRGRANDAAVARAQGEAALEMLRTLSEIVIEQSDAASGSLSVDPHAVLRESGKFWPPGGDPFVTVPGLRNLRTDSDGRIHCDLVLSGACLAAMPTTLRARLESRLARGDRIVGADSRGGE